MAVTLKQKQAAKEATEILNSAFTIKVPAYMAEGFKRRAENSEPLDQKQKHIDDIHKELNAIRKAIQDHHDPHAENDLKTNALPEVVVWLNKRDAELRDELKTLQGRKV